MPDLLDVASKTAIPIGGKIELTNGKQILLSRQDGGDWLWYKWLSVYRKKDKGN